MLIILIDLGETGAVTSMRYHRFDLILGGPGAEALFDDAAFGTAADRLFNAGCDDGTFGLRCGVPYAAFVRAAPTLREAILSAIADVEGASIGLRVVRIEPDGG
jgi:hypothetical protein